jgi:hypothetical protein
MYRTAFRQTSSCRYLAFHKTCLSSFICFLNLDIPVNPVTKQGEIQREHKEGTEKTKRVKGKTKTRGREREKKVWGERERSGEKGTEKWSLLHTLDQYQNHLFFMLYCKRRIRRRRRGRRRRKSNQQLKSYN